MEQTAQRGRVGAAIAGAGAVGVVAMASFGAPFGRLHLADYQLTRQVLLPSVVDEASAVAFNTDTGTLFIIGDAGRAVAQFTTGGVLINQMALSGFADTEALAYVGGGTFVIAEERLQTTYRFAYTPGATRARSSMPSVVLDPTFSDNVGVEGVCADPTTGAFLVVKQNLPQRVYGATLNFAAGTAVTQDLFAPGLLALQTLSEIASPAVVASVAAGAGRDDVLILSAASRRLVTATRAGTVLSQFDVSALATTMEGVCVGPNGTVYMVSETNLGTASPSSPMLWVLTRRCGADFNRSGAASVQDLFDFLMAYFAGAPAADVNHAAGVSVQDVFDFLGAWFEGCG